MRDKSEIFLIHVKYPNKKKHTFGSLPVWTVMEQEM